MIIKSTNPRFCKGLELNGNILSGDTYGAREKIKTYWDGKWDANRKVWIVNPQKVMDTLNSKYNWGLEICDAITTVESKPARVNNGLCPHCHTYCYGDCQSH